MNSKEYKEIKELLALLEQKIEALWDPAVNQPEEQVFELDSQPGNRILNPGMSLKPSGICFPDLPNVPLLQIHWQKQKTAGL